MATIKLTDIKGCSKTYEDGQPCFIPAKFYAGGKYAGDWASHYCPEHLPEGFAIWDTYEYDLSEYAATSTTFSRNREF
jgi:hypothetical protein